MGNRLAASARARLKPLVDRKFADSQRAFFREHINTIGVHTPECITVAKGILKENPDAAKAEILDACDELLRGMVFEEGRVAFAFLEKKSKSLDESDFPELEKYLSKYVHNWAWCDWLCTGPIADMFEKYPKLAQKTKVWRSSKNRWLRRACVVPFVPLARKGKFIDILLENAQAIIQDEDDLVRKGTGWALREVVTFDEKKGVEFLMRNRDAPRVTLRYATEKLDGKAKERIMKR